MNNSLIKLHLCDMTCGRLLKMDIFFWRYKDYFLSVRMVFLSLCLVTLMNANELRGDTINNVDGPSPGPGVAFTCCPLQDTYRGYACDSVQPSSEFDMNFHQALWNVPSTLSLDGKVQLA